MQWWGKLDLIFYISIAFYYHANYFKATFHEYLMIYSMLEQVVYLQDYNPKK